MESPADKAASIRRWRWIVFFFVIGAIVCGVLLNSYLAAARHTPPRGVSIEDYSAAQKAFEEAHKYRADRNDVLYALAERAIVEKRFETAVSCLASIPTSHPEYGRMARYGQGIVLVELHRAVEAEQQLRELISLEETSPKIKHQYLVIARQRLRHILEVELRFEERHQLLRAVIDRDEDQSFESLVACFPSLMRWNGPDSVQWIEHFQAKNPEDRHLNIALGRYRISQGRLEEARKILEPVVQQYPHDLSALAALIACLRESDAAEDLARLVKTLPSQSPEDPWLLLVQRGALAMQDEKPDVAAAAYEQLLKQDRTCAEAWQGLGQAARLLKDDAAKDRAFKMSTTLGHIQNRLARTIDEPLNPAAFLDIADQCAEISLNREGAVMTRCAMRVTPSDPRVREAISLFRDRLAADHEPSLLDQ